MPSVALGEASLFCLFFNSGIPTGITSRSQGLHSIAEVPCRCCFRILWPEPGCCCRLKVYKAFKEGQKRILVATDLVGRGIDIERVNIVINYDMPETDERHGNGADTYLHRVRICLQVSLSFRRAAEGPIACLVTNLHGCLIGKKMYASSHQVTEG